jgi:virginiamycin A acetyltransferase
MSKDLGRWCSVAPILKEKLNWFMTQTILWKALMKYKFQKRGIEIDLGSDVSWDIVVEPPVNLGKVIVRGNVVIGKHSYVNSGLIFSNVSIGRYCSIGYNVLIGPAEHSTSCLTTHPIAQNENFYKKKFAQKTIIGNDVWVGANSIIKRGIKIADGAIIGAGAVVLNGVPPYSIVAGVPARIIRYRFSEEIVKKLLLLKWWECDEASLSSLDFNNIEKCIETLEHIRLVEKK